MILSEKSRAPGGTPWAELKIDEHLRADCQKSTDIWCCFTYHLQLWIMTGNFYSWDRSIFQYQMMCKSSFETGPYLWKFHQQTQLQNSVGAPGKTNCWTRLSFPYNQKHTSLETFFPSMSCAVLPNQTRWWASSHFSPVFREKCPYKEFPEVCNWHRNTLLYIQIGIFFFLLWPCLAWESNSLTV